MEIGVLRGSMIFFRILNFCLFSYFALVQLNDPDAWLWVLIYAYPIFWTVFPPQKSFSSNIVRWSAILYLLGGIYLFPTKFMGLSDMKDAIPEIEEARESLGLLIASVGIFVTRLFSAAISPKE